MNATHLHLLLNHAPLFGAVAGLLLGLTALVRRSDELGRVALSAVALSAVLLAPVYFSGGSAEDQVEALPGVREALIEQHEEAAELGAIALAIAGTHALAGLLIYRRRPIPRVFVASCVASTLLAFGLTARAANAGGHIRHPEIAGVGAPPLTESD